MIKYVRYFVLVFIVFFSVSACDEDTSWEPVQERFRISLSGNFLTESPDEIQFPVKVLFAIDCSLSMGDEVNNEIAGSDPHFLRINAARQFIDKYNVNENTSFEIMLWNNDVFERTRNSDGQGGFTKDPDELNRVLDQTRNDTMTDYLGTLTTIHTDIERDILRMKQTSPQNLIRSKYIVIFLSDGMSNVQGGLQDDDDIWEKVDDMHSMVMSNDVAGFQLHPFLLLGMFDESQDGQTARQIAETTLQGMADRANGQFRLFEDAESIDFVNIVDMRLTVEYQIKYIVAYNHSTVPDVDLIEIDSDCDGLPDSAEIAVGTNLSNWDSDNDGMSDFFEIRMSSPGHAMDPLLNDSPCDVPITGVWGDADQDGLSDCEEYVKGTDRYIPDTDRDGIPDGIEFIAGTNPLEIQTSNDSDFDGVPDSFEIQQHSSVRITDPKIQERYAYVYHIEDKGLIPIEQGSDQPSYVRQYSFNIEGIDLVKTEGHVRNDNTHLFEGDNIITLYVAQVPEDNPQGPPLFRKAELIVNISDANQTIVLTPADFNLIQ
ncbi:conserved hypothetical protein, secreted [Candidatus Magnetomorum sp. HK-1]|nr:conserved hypothetical protein, secreted [Candidatus Magnetomorum sp. HK-1]